MGQFVGLTYCLNNLSINYCVNFGYTFTCKIYTFLQVRSMDNEFATTGPWEEGTRRIEKSPGSAPSILRHRNSWMQVQGNFCLETYLQSWPFVGDMRLMAVRLEKSIFESLLWLFKSKAAK